MRTMALLLAGVLLTVGCSQNPRVEVPKDGDEKPKAEGGELSAEVMKAWKEAGAEVGWMGANSTLFSTERDILRGKRTLPAFRFPRWREGVIAKLPAPGVAFGLDLSSTQITDEGLKE